MGESHHHTTSWPPAPVRPHHSRLKGGAGEIVEVQGGHIVRSMGRKDRHSKVCTAKGPRDRRVRLAAHTAIQFYDVQDRLGYDRPSKAVDWLIQHAKSAIDELAHLPAWHPSTNNPPPPSSNPDLHQPDAASDPVAEPHEAAASSSSTYGFVGGGGNFLPPSLDSDAIADTIKSFFPIAAAATATPSPSYPPDLLSRTGSHAQDLRLSLQSFQDPILLHRHHHHHHAEQHALLSASSAPFSAFDANSASWSEQNQRMVLWNVTETGGGSGSGGYMFGALPSQAVTLHPSLGQSQFLSQREPLQSSNNSPSVRAWTDDPEAANAASMHQLAPSMSATGFASGGGFSGFRIPARIQGEEEHDGISNKPSSASRH